MPKKSIVIILLALLIPIPACAQDVSPEPISAEMSEAVRGGQTERVQALLDAGEDVNASGAGFTALTFAAMEGHTDIVQLLLDRGADVNAKTFQVYPESGVSRQRKWDR